MRKMIMRAGLLIVVELFVLFMGLVKGPLAMQHMIRQVRIAQHQDGICTCSRARRCSYPQYLPSSASGQL